MAILHNRSDSEEAVQEAFFRLHRKSIEACDASYRGMFFKTLRNHCIDILRKRRVRNEISEPELVAAVVDRNLETAQTVELSKMVFKEINALPDSMKQALLMRVHGQLSYEEISAALDATRQQVRTWIYRARRKLEQSLSAGGFFESDDQ